MCVADCWKGIRNRFVRNHVRIEVEGYVVLTGLTEKYTIEGYFVGYVGYGWIFDVRLQSAERGSLIHILSLLWC